MNPDAGGDMANKTNYGNQLAFLNFQVFSKEFLLFYF